MHNSSLIQKKKKKKVKEKQTLQKDYIDNFLTFHKYKDYSKRLGRCNGANLI